MLTLFYLCLGLPSGPYPSGFPTKTQYAPLLPPTHTHTHTHTDTQHDPPMSFFLIWSHEQKQTMKLLTMCLLHSPVTLSFSDPSIFLNALFWNTLSLCSSQNVRDQVSHPHETTGKTTSLCILSFIFWIANWKTEFLDWMVVGILWVQFALKFFMNAILIVTVVAKSLNFATHSKIYYLSLCCDFFLHSVHETWPHT